MIAEKEESNPKCRESFKDEDKSWIWVFFLFASFK